MEIITKFPSFSPLYNDIFRFRKNIREMLHMFSEALREMDRNTVQYMIEQQQEMMEKQQTEIEKQQIALTEKEAKLAETIAENERLRQQLEELKKNTNKIVLAFEKAPQVQNPVGLQNLTFHLIYDRAINF